MAESQATLWIKLKDDVTAGLNKLKSSLPSFKAVLGGVTAALGVMGVALKASFDSFMENEAAVNRLNTALKAQGFYSKQYSDQLQELAGALQKTTTFSDEAIMETQTLLTTFGLAGAQLESTTKAALDLSNGLGIDLRTATLMLGKAWQGETTSISKYLGKIKEGGSAAEKFAQVLDMVNGRFGGSAAAATQTYAGRIEVLKNKFDELKEKVGKELIPVFEFWVGLANKVIDKADAMTKGTEKQAKFIDKNTQALSDQLDVAMKAHAAILTKDNAMSDAAQKAEKDVFRLSAALEKMKELGKGGLVGGEKKKDSPFVPPSSKAPFDEEAKKLEDKLLEDSKKKIESLTMTNEEIARIETQRMADELDFLGRHEEAKNLLTAQAVKDGEEINKRRAASTMVALNMLSGLASAKTKEIALVGKAAAVATIMVNAHLAASEAFAAFAAIPPVAFAMAGIMYAAGAAQAAQAAGVPMAEGGLVMPTMGGTHALIGEAGRSEAVIPLDDPRTKEKLRDTIGGGSGEVHIHIAEGGTVIADDYSLEQFARKIDEKLFSFRRNRQSTAFD